MIPVKHIDPDDLPLYAMQLLPPEEMEEMSLHLQYSAEARRVLSEIYGDLALLAHTADMHSPPALARQRLMKHVAREKKVIPEHLLPRPQPEPITFAPRSVSSLSLVEPPQKSLAAKVLPWVGWALAAGLAVEAANLYQQRDAYKTIAALDHDALAKSKGNADLADTIMETVKDPSAVHVVLTSTGLKPPPEGRASYDADKGSLIFLASNLAPLQPYKTYELWVIPADGTSPAIPAGTFKPDTRGNASVILPQLPKGVEAKTFGVTVEDGDGTTQPTLPIILKGTAS